MDFELNFAAKKLETEQANRKEEAARRLKQQRAQRALQQREREERERVQREKRAAQVCDVWYFRPMRDPPEV